MQAGEDGDQTHSELGNEDQEEVKGDGRRPPDEQESHDHEQTLIMAPSAGPNSQTDPEPESRPPPLMTPGMTTTASAPDQITADRIIPDQLPLKGAAPKEVRFWNALGLPPAQGNQPSQFQCSESFHSSPQRDQQQ